MRMPKSIHRIDRNWSAKDHSMYVFISGAPQPFKIRGEVLGNEKMGLVSITSM